LETFEGVADVNRFSRETSFRVLVKAGPLRFDSRLYLDHFRLRKDGGIWFFTWVIRVFPEMSSAGSADNLDQGQKVET
jgi:hypothetical protein